MLTQNLKTFYDFVDQPLASLSPQHGMLIICVRMWARGAMARTCPLRLVAPRFVLSGQTAFLVPFHAFMMALGSGAARAIGLAAREDGRVTDDEAMILSALEAASCRNLEQVRAALASLICARNLDKVANNAAVLMLR